jgi:hypothetical protein
VESGRSHSARDGRHASERCSDHRQPERQERRKRGARIDPHGFDAGKKIKGKKRHVLVDTQGLMLHARENHRGRYRRRGLKTPQILMLSLGLGYLTISMY